MTRNEKPPKDLLNVVKLNDYKLVVPKKSRLIVGGKRGSTRREKFDLFLDIREQSVSDIQTLLQNIIIDETIKQQNQKNDPTILRVDGKKDVPIKNVKKKIQVWYGAYVSKAAMHEVQYQVSLMLNQVNNLGSYAVPHGNGPWMRAGYSGSFRSGVKNDNRERISKLSDNPAHQKSRGEWRTRNIPSTVNDWAWLHISKNNNHKGKWLNGPQNIILSDGDMLIFKPKSKVASFYTAFQLYWARRNGWLPGQAFREIPSGVKGPMAHLAQKMRRKALLTPFLISTKWFHSEHTNYWKVGIPSVSLLVGSKKK